MTFHKKPPFSMTVHQIEKHIDKTTRAHGETLKKNIYITIKFHEILTKTEGDINKNWSFARNPLFHKRMST